MACPAPVSCASVGLLSTVARGMVSAEVLRYVEAAQGINDENWMALCGNLSAQRAYIRGEIRIFILRDRIEAGDGVGGSEVFDCKKPARQVCAPSAWNSVVQFLCGEVEAEGRALEQQAASSLVELSRVAAVGLRYARFELDDGLEWDNGA